MPGKPKLGTVDSHTCCAYKLLHRLVTHTRTHTHAHTDWGESTRWVAVMTRQVPGGVQLTHTLYKDVLEDMADASTSSKLRCR